MPFWSRLGRSSPLESAPSRSRGWGWEEGGWKRNLPVPPAPSRAGVSAVGFAIPGPRSFVKCAMSALQGRGSFVNYFASALPGPRSLVDPIGTIFYLNKSLAESFCVLSESCRNPRRVCNDPEQSCGILRESRRTSVGLYTYPKESNAAYANLLEIC